MARFKLKSKFSPTGDQPQAIKKLVSGLKKGAQDQVLLGVTGSGKTFTMANVIEKMQRPTLVISHNKTLAAQLAGEFQEFFPNNAVHYFVSYYDYYMPESYIPYTDTYIEKETSLNEEIDRLRHAATQALLTRKDVIIVASVSCIFGLGSPEQYANVALQLTINNKQLARKKIIKQLVEMRYERNDIDFHRGTFRVQGPTVDVFPSFAIDEMYRLSFKGEKLNRLEILNPLTMEPVSAQKNIKTKKHKNNSGIDKLTIFPATHYVPDFTNLEDILKQIRQDMLQEVKLFKRQNKLVEAQRIQQRIAHDIEMIRQTGYCNGIENYSRYFDGRQIGEPPFTLLDYYSYPLLTKEGNEGRSDRGQKPPSLSAPRATKSPLRKGGGPNEWLLIIDESHMTIPQIRGMYAGDRSRKQTLVDYGFRLKAALDNRPLNFNEFEQHMLQTIYMSATPGPYELEKATLRQAQGKQNNKHIIEQLIRPTGLVDPKISIRPIKHQIDDLMNEIEVTVKKKQRVLVTTMTKRMAEDLADYLQEANMKACYLHSDIVTLERLEILKDLREGKHDILVGINLLREGLDLPEVSLVAILDADKEGFLRSDTALIQTMGRAARHIEGRVIMYADKITGSMKRAIDEVQRRRKYQEVYNKKHRITPKGIQKEIKAGILGRVNRIDKSVEEDKRMAKAHELPQYELTHLISDLDAQMELAAQNLEFERAAILRDQAKNLKELQTDRDIKKALKKGDRFAALKKLK